jgi:hypothetical protein
VSGCAQPRTRCKQQLQEGKRTCLHIISGRHGHRLALSARNLRGSNQQYAHITTPRANWQREEREVLRARQADVRQQVATQLLACVWREGGALEAFGNLTVRSCSAQLRT